MGLPEKGFVHWLVFASWLVNWNISELGSCCPQLEGMGICLDLLGSAWIYLEITRTF